MFKILVPKNQKKNFLILLDKIPSSREIDSLTKMVECWISLRTVIHGAAFIFFTLQMVFAVQKYMAKPTMVSPETRQFSSLKKPLQITVFKVDQFNNTRAAELAYSLQNHFLAGEITIKQCYLGLAIQTVHLRRPCTSCTVPQRI